MTEPNETTAGGEAAPESTPSGEGGLTDEQIAQVRESLGLAEGQNISTMVTGAVKRTVAESMGLEKGQTLKSVLDSLQAPPAAPAKPAKKDDPTQAELLEIKKNLAELQAAKDHAEQQALTERRTNAISAALDKFDVIPAGKKALSKIFLHGHEGAQPDFDEDGALVVEGDNGMPQPFDSFLSQYFAQDENKALLSKPAARGSGARGKSGAKKVNGSFDPNDRSSIAEAYRSDPEGTAEAMRQNAAEKAARLGMPY